MSRAGRYLKEQSGKTSITQIFLDIRRGLGSKFNRKTSKTNFDARGGVFEFFYEDGNKYRIRIENIGKSKWSE